MTQRQRINRKRRQVEGRIERIDKLNKNKEQKILKDRERGEEREIQRGRRERRILTETEIQTPIEIERDKKTEKRRSDYRQS